MLGNVGLRVRIRARIRAGITPGLLSRDLSCHNENEVDLCSDRRPGLDFGQVLEVFETHGAWMTNSNGTVRRWDGGIVSK